MQTGKFMGIENGEMKIEYQTKVSVNHRDGPDENGNWSDMVEETRVFSYPAGEKSHRDTFFSGFGPREGTLGFRPDLPAIGQEVRYDGPTPDMGGHLMVNVYPAGAA